MTAEERAALGAAARAALSGVRAEELRGEVVRAARAWARAMRELEAADESEDDDRIDTAAARHDGATALLLALTTELDELDPTHNQEPHR